MKSSEVIRLLDCTRTCLSLYVKQGKIKVRQSETGRYDYDDESVYALRNSRITKQSYLYMFCEPTNIDENLQNAKIAVNNLGGSIDHILIDSKRYDRQNLEKLIQFISQGKVSYLFVRRGDFISDSAEEIMVMLCNVQQVKVVII